MRKIKLSTSSKNFNKSLFFDCLLTVLILTIMLVIISNPKQFSTGTTNGLKLFFYSVLPGLLPFMFLTKLLTEIGFLFKASTKLTPFSKKVFGTPGVSLYAFFMSILSGYPIGAKIISDLHQKQLISENDANKMSFFCTTSGPVFVIGAVGIGMFHSFKIGLIIYISHITSSILLGIIYNLLSKKQSFMQTQKSPIIFQQKSENIMSNVVSETVNSLFIVGAYITIFYLAGEIFDYFKIFDFLSQILSPALSTTSINHSTLKSLLYGLLEVTHGAKELSFSLSPINIALVSGIISFGGISIIMQSLAFLKTCKIKAHTFVFAKCVHMILSICVCWLILVI